MKFHLLIITSFTVPSVPSRIILLEKNWYINEVIWTQNFECLIWKLLCGDNKVTKLSFSIDYLFLATKQLNDPTLRNDSLEIIDGLLLF